MPELPEVETVRRSLAARLQGLCLESMHILHPDVLTHPSPRWAGEVLAGAAFREAGRRGKYLLLRWETGAGDRAQRGDAVLVVHLRMTGRLFVCSAEQSPQRHTHLRARLSDGAELRFQDMRRFGRLLLVPTGVLGPLARRAGLTGPAGPVPAGLEPDPARAHLFKGLLTLGPEPLSASFRAHDLGTSLSGRRAPIKAALLDQRLVAGLGNIYVDEALFRSRLAPSRPAGDLTAAEVSRLHRAIRAVMREAIRYRGTTFSDYRDGLNQPGEMAYRLRVFGRAGRPCPRCGTPIEKTRVAGRGTYRCPRCQSEGDGDPA